MNDGTPFGNPGPDYGLWWRRVFAQLLDGLIITVIIAIPLIIVIALIAASSPDQTGSGFGLFLLLFLVISAALVASWLYAPLLMMRQGQHNGQSWGKQALGIRVIRDAEETPYTFGPAFVRQVLVIGVLFGGLGSVLGGIPLLADYLWPLWDKQNRALHDMVVDSRVIRVQA